MTPLFPNFDLNDKQKVFKNTQIEQAVHVITANESDSKEQTEHVKIASPDTAITGDDLKHVMVGENLLTPNSQGTLQ